MSDETSVRPALLDDLDGIRQAYLAMNNSSLLSRITRPAHTFTAGDLLDAGFWFYRRHIRTLVSSAAIVMYPTTLIIIVTDYFWHAPLLLSLLLDMLTLVLLIGILTYTIERCDTNRSPDLHQALRVGIQRYFPLLLACTFELMILAVPIGLALGCVAYAYTAPALNIYTQSADTDGERLGYAIGLLFVLTYPILFSVLSAGFLVTPQAVLLERQGPIASIRRSWRLTHRDPDRAVVAFVLIVMMYSLGQLPVVVLRWTRLGQLITGNEHQIQLLTIILVQVGLMVAVPLHLIISRLLHLDLCQRREGSESLQQEAK